MESVAAASMIRYLEAVGKYVRSHRDREAAARHVVAKVNTELGKLKVNVNDGVGIALFVASWGFLCNAPPRTTK